MASQKQQSFMQSPKNFNSVGKKLKQTSLQALEIQVGRAIGLLVTEAQEIEIKKWVSEHCNITINQPHLIILENYEHKY
jgi:hypothetical protein